MGSVDRPHLPSIAAAIGPILLGVPEPQRPLFLAIAERLAAERYREWAASFADGPRERLLRACAEREEEIASRVEALYPDAGATQMALRAAHPDLTATSDRLFASRPLAEQFAIQASGERAGASTWRDFASRDDARRATFLRCAELEEESALILESFLREDRG